MKKIKDIFLIIYLLLSSSAFARDYMPLQNIGTIVDKELELTMNTINLLNKSPNKKGSWHFNLIRLRAIALIGVEIDWLLSARIEPEIEIYLTRE